MIAEAEDRNDGGLLAAREKIKNVLIAPCVKQKRIVRGGFPLRFDAMPQCDGAELAQCWLDRTSEAPARFRAENLYAGAGWHETLAAFREAGGPEKADLFILSAGFGLVHYAEELPSYTATFSKDACRIAQFITSSTAPFAVRHREWWRAINQARLANSSPLAALAPQYPHARFWVAASQDYLAAARDDLNALAVACGPEKLFFQTNWDIVPQESGVQIYSIQGESSPIFLVGKKWIRIFSDLIVGITETELLRKYTSKDIPPLLSRLKNIGAIKVEETKSNIADEKNYLDLLENNAIGPGKIVRQVIQCPISSDNPFCGKFHVSYGTGFAPRLISYQSSLSGGWGADTTSLLADIKSAVEAVERYGLAEYDEASLTKATWEQVKNKALTAVQLGTSEETLENAQEILWGEHEGNIEGSIVAPLDFLHHPLDYGKLNRQPITALNISGVAAHQSIDAAITNGLLELCEHEALVVAWYGQSVNRRIKLTHYRASRIDPPHRVKNAASTKEGAATNRESLLSKVAYRVGMRIQIPDQMSQCLIGSGS